MKKDNLAKKKKGMHYAKMTFIYVAVFQGFRLLFNPDAETAASAIVVAIFGGLLFASIAYLIGYLKG